MTELKHVTANDGARIAYCLDGDAGKPVLVLSNSIATTLEMWDGEVDALSRHFRVLRYDLRGHGGSSVPVGAYSIDRLGHDVIDLLAALNIERAHFLGLSLGGIIGQWLGVHATHRIDRLILSNSSAYIGPAKGFNDNIANVRQAADMSQAAEGFLNNWFPAKMVAANGPVIQKFRTMLLGIDRQGLAGLFAAIRDSDFRRTNALITVPTLVIAGKYDTVTAASHSELIAATIPGAKLVVFPAVHLSNVEFPIEFVATVVEFLR